MKHIILILLAALLFSCGNNNNKTLVEKGEYDFNNDTVFSWFYRTSPLVRNGFRIFLDEIKALAPSEKQAFALDFLEKQTRVPLIESDTIVHFLYWGKTDSVFVAGDATGWAPTQKMKNINGTDLWFATATYPSDTRIEYKIVVNGSTWQLDSLNKQTVMGGMGENSELTLPAYQKPLFIVDIDSVPKGTYFDQYIQSNYLNEKRKFRVYLPPGYENSTEKYPVIMFHDGIQFFEMTSSFNTLNNLIYQNKIQPFIAVFIDPVQRDDEYSGSLQENYTNFITEELTAYMDSAYRTIPDANERAQIGISNGGNISLWIVASHPENFLKVAALSSNVQDKINTEFEKDQNAQFKIYLLKSKYELPVLIPRINKLEKTISKINCEVLICEYPEGHNWAFWQKHLPEALEFLFPAESH